MSENRNMDQNERGFNSMENEQHREVSNRGGQTGSGGRTEESGPRTGSSRRGFAAMDPERQRQIARQGGKAAHEQGVAHQWTSEEARAAGKKGGQNSRGGGRKNESDRA